MQVGTGLNQSRLDCFYASNRGAWFSHVVLIKHDVSQTLLDHYPVIIHLNLVDTNQGSLPKLTYLKMDVPYLNNAEFRTSLQEAWGTPAVQQDPKVFWD